MIVRLSEASHNLGNLLFIHGMCHGAWCWDQGFMQLFTKEGYNCYAINLRKHDSSGKTAGINKVSIQDYLQNIKAAISEIGDEVILIGNSMGGFMIQKYLEKHHIERAVLII